MYVFSFVKKLVDVSSSKYFTFSYFQLCTQDIFFKIKNKYLCFLEKNMQYKIFVFFPKILKLFYYILKLFMEISIPKKGTAKECSNYHTTALLSHAGKVMFKILEDRLQSM